MQAAVAAHPIGEAGTLQLSAGAAELSPEDDATRLFERADHALYRAKQSGRAEVASADRPEHGAPGHVRGPGP
jgi:PleD family two-component response regulator